MTDLKKCPKCKGEPRVISKDDRGGYPLWGVYCPCQAQPTENPREAAQEAQLYRLEELVVTDWKQRAEIIALRKALEGLLIGIDDMPFRFGEGSQCVGCEGIFYHEDNCAYEAAKALITEETND